MIEVTRTQLLPGVHLTAVQTQKFKSSVLGMQFLLPLAREQAALHALLPMVLRRGTAEHPDMESLSAVLDELYGGSLEPTVRKKGETQCVGFVGSFLDDAYTLDGSAVLEAGEALLLGLVLSADACGVGLSAAAAGFSVYWLPFFAALLQTFFLSVGAGAGKRLMEAAPMAENRYTLLSGGIFLAMGLLRLFW